MRDTEMDSPAGPTLAARWVGRVIDDRYKILEVLGEGGMGAVFVAEHLRLRKPVAFKTIRAEFAAHSQAESRFAREALATARLDHPHVASAIDYGPLPEGGFYLVTQLVRGESLSKRLSHGPLTWPQVCQLGGQIADALAAAHAIGIVHRDLKPDNILLEQRTDNALHARVVDFGIARVSGDNGGTIADASQPITRAGAVIGTPGYMAPEQAVGGQVDQRVDLYALGVVLWECAAGQQLWQGDSLTELYSRQLSRPAPSLRGDVPDALADMLDRLLARAPGDRPASAQVVRDELRRLALTSELADGPAPLAASASASIHPAPTPGEVTLADVRPSSAATLPTGGGPSGAAGPRSRLPIFIGLGVALLGVLIALALLTRDDGGGDKTGKDKPHEAKRDDRAPAPANKPARPAKSIDELLAEIPPNHVDDVKMLLVSRLAEARRVAAEEIVNAPRRAALPEYVRDLAQLEIYAGCGDKKQILAKLDRADEARALPVLKRLAEAAATDPALECLRDDVTRMVARFEP